MPADGNIWYSEVSGDSIRVPPDLGYGPFDDWDGRHVRSKIVTRPPWTTDSTLMDEWGIGHQPEGYGYDLDESGSLWVPKFLTLNIDGLVDCGSPHGKNAVAELGAQLLLPQVIGGPYGELDIWNHWSTVVNGWYVWVGRMPLYSELHLEMSKDFGGEDNRFIAFFAQHFTIDVREFAAENIANLNDDAGDCGDRQLDASGDPPPFICAHSGTVDLLLGDQT